ncbi:MAG TPA: bifunctional glutamate N-acetyltransferase/amino-acid acetyltransferase ArgJ, partial [Rhizomicrobium sp.]|nr:bifunctional glutamate N-acetyltransferase/amino-acid acetyltransferase ArgJ [Rhizomicrobium sp.]
ELAVGRAGLYKHERNDVMLMGFAEGTACAGVFTRHGVGSAPVDWCKRHLETTGGRDIRALVVNAGCANSFTGRPGADAARRVASAAAKRFDCRQNQVMMASTGVIGVLLPDAKITARMPEISKGLSADGWAEAAAAIMTTDTFAKGATAEATIEGQTVRIAGIAKGSGMIAPDMATMLSFIFTDATLPAAVLQELLSAGVKTSFNAITVDSDTSTSDTLLLFATGKGASHPAISKASDKRLNEFRGALDKVLLNLALQVVRDGEGAQKLIRIDVTGAESDDSAKRIGLSIANSPLVKTAIAGEDANWGRVVMAVGKSGEPADRDKLKISFGGQVVAEAGERAPKYNEAAATKAVKGREVEIAVDIGLGNGRARVWTCDLTHGYIDINGSYRS